MGFVPILYFLLAAVIASAGPGNIATIGLLGPIAIATAIRMNISPFLMAIMVGNGVQAGALSPIAPTGVIVSSLMTRIGLARTGEGNLALQCGGPCRGCLWRLFPLRRFETAGAQRIDTRRPRRALIR